MEIRRYEHADQEAVVRLWTACGLLRPWNDPHKDIERKLTVQPDLFLVGVVGERVMATAMVGFDGHRGWVNYLAVDPDYQGRGFGRQLMRRAEAQLTDLGCPKLNVQVRSQNREVLAFYERIGYAVDPVTSLGKRLIEDA